MRCESAIFAVCVNTRHSTILAFSVCEGNLAFSVMSYLERSYAGRPFRATGPVGGASRAR